MDIKVPGMSCGPCANAVTKAVRSVDPAAAVDIDLATKLVSIETTADFGKVEAALEEAGYKAQPADA